MHDDVDASTVLAMHRYAQRYKQRMLEIADEAWLEPSLLGGREQTIIGDYESLITRKIDEWTATLMHDEITAFVVRDKPPDENANGIYILSSAVILFRMLNQQIDSALQASDDDVLVHVVEHACRVLGNCQASWLQIVQQEYKRQTDAKKPDEVPGGLVEYYGMTEGGGSCALLAHEHPDKLHTVGRPLPGHDIRLIDEEGRELPPGATGEVVGRSGAMMTAYHRQPAKTAEAEWFDAEGRRYIRTGDVGRFDAEGFLTLLDRRKDMIISGGENVYSAEVENALAAHPAVASCAVIGVPDDRWGERVHAVVVLRDGAVAPSTDDLREHVAARIARYKAPRSVEYLEALPVSGAGKILKRELRATRTAAPTPA